MISITDCQRVGTIKYEESFCLVKLKKNTKVKKAIKSNIMVSFVILKSIKPNESEKIGNTWNCSKGLVKIFINVIV